MDKSEFIKIQLMLITLAKSAREIDLLKFVATVANAEAIGHKIFDKEMLEKTSHQVKSVRELAEAFLLVQEKYDNLFLSSLASGKLKSEPRKINKTVKLKPV